mmetsp:Transcript_4582/g.12769  ORF Transcript_4582/g.12769 Transcript_4582/m.12769 type:complete len:293 (+) Transcript_4582:186-1064(+)
MHNKNRKWKTIRTSVYTKCDDAYQGEWFSLLYQSPKGRTIQANSKKDFRDATIEAMIEHSTGTMMLGSWSAMSSRTETVNQAWNTISGTLAQYAVTRMPPKRDASTSRANHMCLQYDASSRRLEQSAIWLKLPYSIGLRWACKLSRAFDHLVINTRICQIVMVKSPMDSTPGSPRKAMTGPTTGTSAHDSLKRKPAALSRDCWALPGVIASVSGSTASSMPSTKTTHSFNARNVSMNIAPSSACGCEATSATPAFAMSSGDFGLTSIKMLVILCLIASCNSATTQSFSATKM